MALRPAEKFGGPPSADSGRAKGFSSDSAGRRLPAFLPGRVPCEVDQS
jgi:hypothetical protein